MPNHSIRPARASDCEALAALYDTAFFGEGSPHYWRQQISEHGARVFVSLVDGSVAGFVQARRVADEAEIIAITVALSHRRRGIAADLLEHLEADLRRARPCRLFLEVSVENAAAIALYRSRGFVDVGYRKGYYDMPDRAPVDANVLALDI